MKKPKQCCPVGLGDLWTRGVRFSSTGVCHDPPYSCCNSITVTFALQGLSWLSLCIWDSSVWGAPWGSITFRFFFIFAKFGIHRGYFLLKLPSWEGRKKHVLVIACCHSVKHKIDSEGSQVRGCRTNPLGLLAEEVKRNKDEQKGWGSGGSSMESQQQWESSRLIPAVKGWVGLEGHELCLSPPVWPWVFFLPDSTWHIPRPAQFHTPEDHTPSLFHRKSGPHTLHPPKEKSGAGEKRGLFHQFNFFSSYKSHIYLIGNQYKYEKEICIYSNQKVKSPLVTVYYISQLISQN